ncbi:P-loop NTPase family protein [Paenibacillus wulumuqiensis]|uniref:hypothetical protein n=1 Tax=Paenibacillus wulumuqiensis TaxID=1567107 RepID=UPI00061916B9|nr:hypothetical protein [Paenibacillus wulumuqiensis]
MAPVQIVLCVEDSQYIELLLRYIRESEYAAKVRIRAFSDVDMFMTYMDKEEHRGLVAAEEVFLKRWLHSENIKTARWVRLSEEAEDYTEGVTLAKYQPLHNLLDQLSGMTGRTTAPDITLKEGQHAMITSVYSAAPGSGKSVTAMNMAKQLGLRGQSVFYLNLEAASSTHLLRLERRQPAENGLSRLLYDLQAAAEQKELPVHPPSHYAVYAEEIKADTFEPPENFNELLHMTEQDALSLIAYIAGSREYDHIIIDGESGGQERMRAALQVSDRIIWLLTDDLPCMHKTGLWMSYWQSHDPRWYEQICSRISFVMNRFTGSVMNPLPMSGMELEGTLPYVPSWKQVTSSELLWCSPIFQRDILKLCRMPHDQAYAAGGVGM